MHFSRLILVVLVVSLTACNGFEKIRKSGTDEQKYQAALNYYEKKDYDKAVLLFEELKPILRGSEQQEMATFYEAYSNYYLGLYELASYQFKRFYETFGRSEHAEEALFRSAMASYKGSLPYHLDQASTTNAMDAMQSFLNAYPQSTYAQEAEKTMKDSRQKLEKKAYEKVQLYYRTSAANLQNYRSAVVAATNFQREFPDSHYNEEMALLKVQAQYDFARNSLPARQRERYAEAVKFYQELVDKYPQSNSLRKAERLYVLGNQEIEKLVVQERLAREHQASADSLRATTAPRVGGGNQ